MTEKHEAATPELAKAETPQQAAGGSPSEAAAKQSKGGKRRSTDNLRLLCGLAFFVVVGIGLAFNTGLGTTDSFGWETIAAVCPVGAIETLLAGRIAAPVAIVCLAITVVLVLFFGRAACGWLCPVPVVRRVFGGKKAVAKSVSDSKEEEAACDAQKNAAVKQAIEDRRAKLGVDTSPEARAQIEREFSAIIHRACSTPQCAACASHATCSQETMRVHDRKNRIKVSHYDTRFAVLIGALASSAIAGFPVFCLVCPVGLSVATFIALWRFITMNQGTWGLIVMPAIIIVELVFARKWCHRLCPISAFFSLVGKGNKTLRPTVDEEKCLRLNGTAVCNRCHDVCPEGIDLHDPRGLVAPTECIKCAACVDACPESCITMPLTPKRTGASQATTLTDKEEQCLTN
jgi:ferredoxin-type protein NapH